MEVKSRYDKYEIGKVFNIESDGRNVWVVNLENKKNIIVARIENDDVSEISRLKNATATGYSTITKSNLE